jgi:hypothetical protein
VEQDYLQILLARLRYSKSHQPPEITHWVNGRWKKAVKRFNNAK